MKRLRSTWMALMGGALLVTLSFSAAFGAPPSHTEDGPPGQSVSAFVHGLIFGEQAPGEQLEENEEEEEEEEENVETELEELVVVDGEPGAHGGCVSEVAHDKAGENDPEGVEYANHGERVSEAARFLCWEDAEEADPEASLEEQEGDEEHEDEESDADTAGAGPGKSGDAGAHGKANAPGQQKVQAGGSHGGPPSWAGQGGGGGGNGRGGR